MSNSPFIQSKFRFEVQEEVMSRVCKDGRFENTASILKLEYGIACHHFSADNEAKVSKGCDQGKYTLTNILKKQKMHYKAAQESSGLKWELTGALGKRTKFQTFDVAQLIIIATSTDKSKSDASLTKQLPENLPLNDDTLLESISITDLENDTNDLKIVDQCILLAFW